MIVREVPFDDALLRGIVEIHNETARSGREDGFLTMEWTSRELVRYAGTFLDRSIFIGAFLEDKLIGFIKLTIDEAGLTRVP